MKKSSKFLRAREELRGAISRSLAPEDPSHAENTMEWVARLRPDADEILLLAGFGHDIERSAPDRYTNNSFDTYDDYKRAHARRSGEMAAEILVRAGYSKEDGQRLAHIIAEGEFASSEPDVQLLCDADSISFFDNNLTYYIQKNGQAAAKKKIEFTYHRASKRAKYYIQEVLRQKPALDLLGIGKA